MSIFKKKNGEVIPYTTPDMTNFAAKHDPESVYSKNQYATKNGKIYKANEDDTTGEWTSEKWTGTTVGAELEELRTEIEAQEEGSGGGGGESRTRLWTNPSPDSGMNSASITYSDTLSNYNFVEIGYKSGTTTGTVRCKIENNSFNTELQDFLVGYGEVRFYKRKINGNDIEQCYSQLATDTGGPRASAPYLVPVWIDGIKYN